MSGNQRQGGWDLNDWCVSLLLHLLLKEALISEVPGRHSQTVTHSADTSK